MRAIMVMYDTLIRQYLPPYGAEGIHAPNFERLRQRSVTFDNCYAGSMPCMPARRELHTGRYNFLHRSWGPLEPFDDSVPEMLSRAGVYTHLVTDHYHYWEDGGATYHNRFTSYELFRGQEGDKWKGHVADPEVMANPGGGVRQDTINRLYMQSEDQHYQTRTFDAGLAFLETNHAEDNWFLQIETFDPHEPFFSYDEHRAHYPHEYDGPHFDWPKYGRVSEDDQAVDHIRAEYSALLTMCDKSLGRVLDAMDAYDLWDDTLLIVCTDHGFLLGERGWWGKAVQPWYDETIHTPLFIWDPRAGSRDERRASLVQTIDLGPTLLEWFGVDRTPDMRGRALPETVARDEPVREAGLFGSFGGHVNVTDGRYVYMRACAEAGNAPLAEHTLMPTHMKSRFSPEELRGATLAAPFSFTKGVPTLELPTASWGSPYASGTLLFDLETDPRQRRPLVDDQLELRMATLMVELMRAHDAPAGQFARMGLPATGPVTPAHLLARRQQEQVAKSLRPLPRPAEFRTSGLGVHSTFAELLADPRAREVLTQRAPELAGEGMRAAIGRKTPYQIAGVNPAVTIELLHLLDDALETTWTGHG